MNYTYVLIKNYDGDVEVLAAGNDLSALRTRLVRHARHVIANSDFESPGRKALKKRLLEDLNNPLIMNWDDEDYGDLFSLHIQKVPSAEKKPTGKVVDYQQRILSFLEEKFAYISTLSEFRDKIEDYVDYEDVDIIDESINAGTPGVFEIVESVYVTQEKIYVTLVEYGEAGDGHDDLTREVDFRILPPSVQKIISKYIIWNYNPENFK